VFSCILIVQSNIFIKNINKNDIIFFYIEIY